VGVKGIWGQGETRFWVAQRFQRCDKSISLDAGPAGNKQPNYDIPKSELDQLPRPLFS
jgi:hypothetical protein